MAALRDEIDRNAGFLGQTRLAQLRREEGIARLRDAEFKVFSQFGEDGILQYLLQRVPIENENESFIEFGVEDYREANTRFLLINNNWRGLIIDGDPALQNLRHHARYWRHELSAVTAFGRVVSAQ